MRDRIALLFCFHAAAVAEAATASHSFTSYEAEVFWAPWDAHQFQDHASFLEHFGSNQEPPVRILHLTDNHISIDDPYPPHTTRMFNAFAQTNDFSTQEPTSPKDEFVALLRKAKKEGVDLIALGGDLVNYPSEKTVAWVLQQLKTEAADIPFIYTAGNHDWHEESISEESYDSQRLSQLQNTLRPLLDNSIASADSSAGPAAGRLYGKAHVRGVDVFFIDNSNYQVNEEQHRYLEQELQKNTTTPAVLLMHMPLKLRGIPSLEPKYVCGDPTWGADTDELHDVEGRPPWPAEGNSASTMSFIQMVEKSSAPQGRLAALLTGHVHKDFHASLRETEAPDAASLTSLACGNDSPGCQLRDPKSDERQEAIGAIQYTTLDAAEGGYRLLTVHRGQKRMSIKSRQMHLQP